VSKLTAACRAQTSIRLRSQFVTLEVQRHLNPPGVYAKSTRWIFGRHRVAVSGRMRANGASRSDADLTDDAVGERPTRSEPQGDSRHRFWAPIPELGGRHLRVVTLADKVTILNAFPDRGFKP
jgi:hypothetical protein